MPEPRYIFGVGIPDELPPDPLGPQELADGIRGDLTALRDGFDRGTAYDALYAHLDQVIDRTSSRLTFLLAQCHPCSDQS